MRQLEVKTEPRLTAGGERSLRKANIYSRMQQPLLLSCSPECLCSALCSEALFGCFGLRRVFSCVQSLEEAEEAGCFSDAAELDAEGLDLDEEVLDIDDLVSDQRLEEDADQSHQSVLKGTENMWLLVKHQTCGAETNS